jgi:hypothetical protein
MIVAEHGGRKKGDVLEEHVRAVDGRERVLQ